jgi:hypothetical protein
MATRGQISELLGQGHTYETAGKALHIPAGQAFMIVTGLSADSGDTPTPAELAGSGVLPGSWQQLVNPPAFNPKREQRVLNWVEARAARELKRGS